MSSRLIGIDWGTSSLRGALLDESGVLLEERAFERGILSVAAGGFDAVFRASFGDWLAPGCITLISGMAGSRQGWAEAPYAPCPAGFADLAAKLRWLAPDESLAVAQGHAIALVPGLSYEPPSLAGEPSVPDVMRGEEVQIFGAMQALSVDAGRFVLPGTHNKWARVSQGRITGFRTSMTGEFFALLREHSILARTLDAQAPHVASAFARGVRRSLDGGGLLHNAFGMRALGLFGRLPAAESASYLSGLLIGEELAHEAIEAGDELVLIGSPALCARYAEALEPIGARTIIPSVNVTWRGLHALWRALEPLRLPR